MSNNKTKMTKRNQKTNRTPNDKVSAVPAVELETAPPTAAAVTVDAVLVAGKNPPAGANQHAEEEEEKEARRPGRGNLPGTIAARGRAAVRFRKVVVGRTDPLRVPMLLRQEASRSDDRPMLVTGQRRPMQRMTNPCRRTRDLAIEAQAGADRYGVLQAAIMTNSAPGHRPGRNRMGVMRISAPAVVPAVRDRPPEPAEVPPNGSRIRTQEKPAITAAPMVLLVPVNCCRHDHPRP